MPDVWSIIGVGIWGVVVLGLSAFAICLVIEFVKSPRETGLVRPPPRPIPRPGTQVTVDMDGFVDGRLMPGSVTLRGGDSQGPPPPPPIPTARRDIAVNPFNQMIKELREKGVMGVGSNTTIEDIVRLHQEHCTPSESPTWHERLLDDDSV